MHMPASILMVLLLRVFVVHSKTLKWTSNPYLIPPINAVATTQYLVFHGPLSLNYTLSRTRCESLGGDLADVDSSDVFAYLHTRLHSPAFVGSFDGKTYKGHGLALYPGGAVAIPEGGGAGRFPSICEVPLLGTFAIDLTRYAHAADRSAAVGGYGEGHEDAAAPDMAALMRAGFVVSGRRDPRFAGLSAQEEPVDAKGARRVFLKQGTLTTASSTTTQPITTVTIYGSIETDPALPCCRCCNAI